MQPTYGLPKESVMLMSAGYSPGETRGVTFLVLISWVSLIAVVGLLLVIAVSAYNTRKSPDDKLFVRSRSAAYFISLLVCNLIQAIASIMSTAWVHNKGVFIGPVCTAQGLLAHISDIGMALWIMALSAQTFSQLFLKWEGRGISLWGTIFCVWAILFAFILLGPATANVEKSGFFYAISGSSCWISPHYKAGEVLLDRLIMFLVALLSLVFFLLVFSQLQWNMIFARRTSEGSDDWKQTQPNGFPGQMQVYPIAYIVLILPLLISQFALWAGSHVSFGLAVFCSVIYILSGLVNAVLFLVVCPVLPPGSWRIGQQLPEPSSRDETPNRDRNGHRRTMSEISDDSTVVGGAKKNKLRPPDIIITRDSMESVYSVYEEDQAPVAVHDAVRPDLLPHSAPARTYWSPESPRRHTGRLPV